MANKVADNAIFGELLVWTNLGTDTAVVYKYVCPVNSHVVVSPVRMQTNSAGSATEEAETCPLHHAVLTGETAVAVS